DRLHGALPRLQWFVEDADDRRAGMKSKTTPDGPAAQTGALQQGGRADRAGGRHHGTTADDQGPGRHAFLSYGRPHANGAAIFDEDPVDLAVDDDPRPPVVGVEEVGLSR